MSPEHTNSNTYNSANVEDQKVDDMKATETGVNVVLAIDHDGEKHIVDEDEFTPKEYRRLMWKVDLIMLPLMCLTYGLQFADKQSLSSGVVFGLREDTHMKGNEYANLGSLFYMALAIAQFPMAWVIQRFPLGKSLAVCALGWGAMVVLLGVCNTYAQLAAVRVLLGVFESVIIPGYAILTTSWYLRSEQTLRQSCYYSMNTAFGIFSSIVIYLLADYAQKKGTIAPWRVINFFLGAFTIFAALINLVFIGTPEEVWWLSKREKRMAHARIVSNATGGAERQPWKWSQVRECFRDPQYYFIIFFNILSTIPNGAIVTFNNLIYKGFGFTIIYNMPTLAVGFCFVVIPAILVSYYPKTRFFLSMFILTLCAACYMYLGLCPTDTDKWTRWSVYLFSTIFAGAMFCLWPLLSINVAGRTKKAWMNATSMITFAAGNIIGAQIFLPSDAPRYTRGLTACAAIMLVNVIVLGAWRWYYVIANRRRDAAFEASGMSEEEREAQKRLAGEEDHTDMENAHFRYSC